MKELINKKSVGIVLLMDGSELRQFREKLKLTQEQLAKKLNVATNTIARWERGERKIPEFLELALKTVEREINN